MHGFEGGKGVGWVRHGAPGSVAEATRELDKDEM